MKNICRHCVQNRKSRNEVQIGVGVDRANQCCKGTQGIKDELERRLRFDVPKGQDNEFQQPGSWYCLFARVCHNINYTSNVALARDIVQIADQRIVVAVALMDDTLAVVNAILGQREDW